ncbi:Major facilitator superfamily [Macrophomina phaseolina MS6]|uniref:Major facilitator superfamily n=1 Tax=Macrophomina phaseolina (strain MS6) TaxID=1126212 RepID=K2RKF4_MACPH|nr:Major facilitator superfamily [Macrophomina phaseolina MS6]
MGLTFEQLNNAQSANLAGLAMGCVFFIPLTKKYGRRSTYVVSTAVMAAIAWWSTYMKTTAELFLTNLFFGLAGATNETIVQMTVSGGTSFLLPRMRISSSELRRSCPYLQIADMFFLHQRGTANAIYLTAVMVGSFLTPMAAGVQAQSQGWRKSYLALAISLSVLFAIFLVGYEETKYVPVVHGLSTTLEVGAGQAKNNDDGTKKPVELQGTALELTASKPGVSTNVPLNSYRQRLRWITPTSESLLKIAYFPIYVIVLPHVMYAALQYASGVCWLVIQASILSIVFSKPPYNFSTAGIGLMSLGPFVGNLLGSFYTGLLTDRSIRWLAKRNGGYYEPEMRLYLLLPPAILMAGGQIMFGITTDRVSALHRGKTELGTDCA